MFSTFGFGLIDFAWVYSNVSASSNLIILHQTALVTFSLRVEMLPSSFFAFIVNYDLQDSFRQTGVKTALIVRLLKNIIVEKNLRGLSAYC